MKFLKGQQRNNIQLLLGSTNARLKGKEPLMLVVSAGGDLSEEKGGRGLQGQTGSLPAVPSFRSPAV